jgi:hypothetical protein
MSFDLGDELLKLQQAKEAKWQGKAPLRMMSNQSKGEKRKPEKQDKPSEIQRSFIKFDDGRIAEQIYNPRLISPHQYIINNNGQLEYLPQIALMNNIYIPAGKELVEKGVVLLPSEPIEYVNDRHLFDEIQTFIHRYLDVSLFHEQLSVLYAKYSWIHDQYTVASYLRARGDYGTGKSRLLQTVGAIAYKPMFCGGSTSSSSIFRLIEMFKGTLILDEADFKNTDLYIDIIKILNQGYMQGLYVLRTEKDGQKWEPKPYDVYGCKVIATRKKYQDQALESRMFTIEMESTKRKDVPLVLTADFWEEAQIIRNKLLVWRFKHYGKAQIKTEHIIAGIENRLNQIIMPILSITDEQALINDIKESVREYQKEMVKDRGLDLEATILEAIVNLKPLKDHERTLKVVAEEANNLLGHANTDKLTPKKVGKINRDSLKLKTARRMDGYYIIWDDKKIKALGEKYGLTELLEQDRKISDYDNSMVANPDLKLP